MIMSRRLPRAKLATMAEELLKYLATDAIPQDRMHRWVEDIPWDHIIRMIIGATGHTMAPTARAHVITLSQLLEMELV